MNKEEDQLVGQMLKEQQGQQSIDEMGKVDADVAKERLGTEHFSAIGQLGGLSTKSKYGREYYVALAEKSAAKTLPIESGYIALAKAADQYGISPHVVDGWAGRKLIVTYKFAGYRDRYAKVAEIEDWAALYRKVTAGRKAAKPPEKPDS